MNPNFPDSQEQQEMSEAAEMRAERIAAFKRGYDLLMQIEDVERRMPGMEGDELKEARDLVNKGYRALSL